MSQGYTRFTNSILEAAYSEKSGLTLRELRVFLCVIRFTSGFKRRVSSMSNGFIANATGMDRSNVRKAVLGLESKGWISVEKTSGLSNNIAVSRNIPECRVDIEQNEVNLTPEGWGQSDLGTGVNLTPKIIKKEIGNLGHENSTCEDTESFGHESDMDSFLQDPASFQRTKENPPPDGQEMGEELPEWMM